MRADSTLRAFRLFSRPFIAQEDQLKEVLHPGAQRPVVLHAAVEMGLAHLGTGHLEAMGAVHHPTVHHRQRQFSVELDAPGIVTVAEGLVGIGVAGCEQLGTGRQVEPS